MPRLRRVRPTASSELVSVAKMLDDPCNADPVQPQYGASSAGYLIRHTTYLNVSGESGFVLWFPDYVGDNFVENEGFNLLTFSTSGGATAIVNSASAPMGYGTTSGNAQIDPAYTWATGGNVQDIRCAAACIKLQYTGRNDALSGRIAYIEDLPREALLDDLTVNKLFTFSRNTKRMPMDPAEVKFAPNDGSEHFRSTSREDAAIVAGIVGNRGSSIADSGITGTGNAIGFAWSGMESDQNISFDVTKISEWRPTTASGVVMPAPSVARSGGNLMSRAVAYLDTHKPDWRRTAGKYLMSAASSLASMAFSGPAGVVAKAAPMLLGN